MVYLIPATNRAKKRLEKPRRNPVSLKSEPLTGIVQYFVRLLPTTDREGYRIDHGSSIAVIDPDANLFGLFTGAVDAASIAADITVLALNEAE